MSEILFFRQARRDGGMRTGIEVDGEPVLHRFDEGKSESDPVLLWFIDVLIDGPQLPVDAEAVRDWLLDHKRPVVEAMSEFAKELEAGVDLDALPVSKQFCDRIPHGKLRLTCSAARRTDARKIAQLVRDLARRWTSVVKRLGAIQKASH